MLDRIRDKNRYLIVGFAVFTYLLITVPSGLAAWLSLVDRFSREGNAFVLMSNLAWYPIGLLILGLAIVTVGIWWIRAKDKVKGTEATPEVTTMSEPIRDRLGDMVEEELNNLTELPTEIDRQLPVKGTEATPEVTTMSEPIRDRLGDMVEEELNNLTELPTEIDRQLPVKGTEATPEVTTMSEPIRDRLGDMVEEELNNLTELPTEIDRQLPVKGTEATPEVTTMSEPIRDRLGDMVEEELNNLTELPTEIDRQLPVKGTEATPEVTTMSEPIRDRLGDMVEEELNNLMALPTEIDTQSFPPTFLDVSTADLVGIYKGRTTAQAKPLVDVYVGNMIHIRGSVVDIRESSNGRQHIVSLREGPSDILGPSISAYFDKELAGELQFLSINQSVSVLGKIDEINRWGGIRLESCLLLTDVSTADLVGIYKGRTTAQAKPLVDAYVGNMIHIRGSVVDIRESSNGRQHIVSLRERPSDILGPSISAYFDKELAEELQFLSINQSISVLGKIDDVDRLSIRLESCLLARGLYG